MRTWPVPRALALCALVVPGCAGTTTPSDTSGPTVRWIAVDDLSTSLRDGGILFVHAMPTDTSFRLHAERRVPVTVRAASGDEETLRLYRFLCPPRNPSLGYNCFQFFLATRPGFAPQALAPLIEAAGGRIHVAGTFIAGITVFDPDDLVMGAREATRWPGVEAVSLVYPGACLPGPLCFSQADLAAPMPVDTGAAAPFDGILQISSGDSVWVEYRQPSGTTARAVAVAP